MDITKSFIHNSINADSNFYHYPRKPKMTDCEIIALSIVGKTIGLDSENWLFRKLKYDHQPADIEIFKALDFLKEREG